MGIRSVVGRTLVVGVLGTSLAVIAHAAMLWKANKANVAGASPVASPPAVASVPAIRVVYPGPTLAEPGLAKMPAQLPPSPPIPETPPPAAAPAAFAPPDVSPAPAFTTTPAPLPAPAESLRPAATAAPAARPAPPTVADASSSAPPAASGPGTPRADAPPASGNAVNINRASIAALDRLQGGGHIGQTIARHRPYTSIEDLVKKRVVRRSVYDKIKDQIATE